MSAVVEVVQSSPIERAIEKLIDKGAVDQVAQLLELKLKYEASEARKAYVSALQAFKADPPQIERTKHVSYPTKQGDKVDYWHAELDVVNDIIQPALRKHGLCATWKPDTDAQGRIIVACILTHAMGHSEEIGRLSGPTDKSGGKNDVQGIGSTTTYLERYTLFAGLGLVPEGKDDDGYSADKPAMPEDAINDYCVAMQDSMSTEELRKYFAEAWEKAKAIGDESAKKRLQKVYEQRKRDLFTAKQEASK